VPPENKLPAPCVVVLVGPSGAGKSTWAAARFRPELVVSSDRLRAVVGASEDDISASADALRLLDEIVAARVGRRLTTVVDSTGLDPVRRRAWLALARSAGIPCFAVGFDTPAELCRARNRARPKPVPAEVLSAQLRGWTEARAALPEEGFAGVLDPDPVRVVPPEFVVARSGAATGTSEPPAGLRFGLHVGTFTPPGGSATLSAWLEDIAVGAEEAGFDAIYVMDHFRQIPQVGRPWEDFLESYTTLSYLAAVTSRVRLGALVTGITHRNVAHLGKIVASLDVLSGGRAVCGLGLAWFEQEHRAWGLDFPPTATRYALLEDALRLLPMIWGPGSPSFEGALLRVPEAVGYPRPLQAHIPITVGGGGERRTLRLAAQYADAANVLGDLDTVARKAQVLRRHCLDVGRDPEQVALSHLSTVLVGHDDGQVAELVERHRARHQDPARYAAANHAGTVADHVGRVRSLLDVGVGEVVVRVAGLERVADLEPMAGVIAALR
jgi:F420-dependent oxidoreductase-like protein